MEIGESYVESQQDITCQYGITLASDGRVNGGSWPVGARGCPLQAQIAGRAGSNCWLRSCRDGRLLQEHVAYLLMAVAGAHWSLLLQMLLTGALAVHCWNQERLFSSSELLSATDRELISDSRERSLLVRVRWSPQFELAYQSFL